MRIRDFCTHVTVGAVLGAAYVVGMFKLGLIEIVQATTASVATFAAGGGASGGALGCAVLLFRNRRRRARTADASASAPDIGSKPGDPFWRDKAQVFENDERHPPSESSLRSRKSRKPRRRA